jgi:hypothetical protein
MHVFDHLVMSVPGDSFSEVGVGVVLSVVDMATGYLNF